MIQLIYSSMASVPIGQEEIRHILQASRNNNASVGVTGLLLFDQNLFLQVLEGETNAVIDTFNRIKRDSRHHDVELLQQHPIEIRDFSAWQMGFKRVDRELDNFSRCEHSFLQSLDELMAGLSNPITKEYISSFRRLIYS